MRISRPYVSKLVFLFPHSAEMESKLTGRLTGKRKGLHVHIVQQAGAQASDAILMLE